MQKRCQRRLQKRLNLSFLLRSSSKNKTERSKWWVIYKVAIGWSLGGRKWSSSVSIYFSSQFQQFQPSNYQIRSFLPIIRTFLVHLVIFRLIISDFNQFEKENLLNVPNLQPCRVRRTLNKDRVHPKR